MSHDRMSLSIARPRDGPVDYVQIRGDVDLSEPRRSTARPPSCATAPAAASASISAASRSWTRLTGLDAVATILADLPPQWPHQPAA
jgi:hypothetical protein